METLPRLRYVRGSYWLARLAVQEARQKGACLRKISDFKGLEGFAAVSSTVARLEDRGFSVVNIEKAGSAVWAFLKIYSAVRFGSEPKILKPGEFESKMPRELFEKFPELTGFFNSVLSIPLKNFSGFGLDREILNKLAKRKNPSLQDALMFGKINLIDHINRIFESLKSLIKYENKNDSIIAPKFLSIIKRRAGEPLTGRKKDAPITSAVLNLNLLYEQIKANGSLYKALLLSVFLHDLGKIISQQNHPIESIRLINESDIGLLLSPAVNHYELELLKRIIEAHSMMADVAIIKEFNPNCLFINLFRSDMKIPEQREYLTTLFFFSMADMDAKGLLLPENKERLVSMYLSLSSMIENEGKALALRKEELIGWGRERWNCWTISKTEDVDTIEHEEQGAEKVLKKYCAGKKIDIPDFFLNLGKLEKITLVYDLTRKLTNVIHRARLIAFVVMVCGHFNKDSIHFDLNRYEERIFNEQIKKLTKLLSQGNYSKIFRQLKIRFEKDWTGKETIIVVIPAGGIEK